MGGGYPCLQVGRRAQPKPRPRLTMWGASPKGRGRGGGGLPMLQGEGSCPPCLRPGRKEAGRRQSLPMSLPIFAGRVYLPSSILAPKQNSRSAKLVSWSAGLRTSTLAPQAAGTSHTFQKGALPICCLSDCSPTAFNRRVGCAYSRKKAALAPCY